MVIDILSYKNSFLNPVMKIITPLLFGIGMYYFYRAQQKYGGELKKISTLLMFVGFAGLAASLFRYVGDFVVFSKWGESMFYLMFGLVSILVAYHVRHRFIDAARALGITEE